MSILKRGKRTAAVHFPEEYLTHVGSHGTLATIMISLCTLLHGHGILILAKIMARSWKDLGKASKELPMDFGKGYHGFEHWEGIEYGDETALLSPTHCSRKLR